MRAAVVIILLVSAQAFAQTPGDDLITKFGLADIRPLHGEIAALKTEEPLDEARYAEVVALRAKHPILGRVGVLDDEQIEFVALALCDASDFTCVTLTKRALRCLADRCLVALPEPEDGHKDVFRDDPECRPNRRRKRAPLLGVGLDWGNGIQRSGGANDGRVTSFGLSARLRFSERYGFIARVDRTDGRDEATDTDGNGVDDFQSRSITRFTALAGPSIVLDSTRFEDSTRSVRLDLLGGYLSTKTLPGEDGIAIGADLAMQLAVFRLGVRVVQGLGEASHETMALLHVGLAIGSTPTKSERDACPPGRRSTGLALGFEIPLVGAGLSSQLGLQLGGFAFEMVWHLTRRLDAITHADLLAFPRRNNKDRVISQAALVGVRFDHGPKRRRKKSNWHTSLMAGVQQVADLEPSTVGDGPIVDAGIGWGGQDDDTAGHLKLHARFGVAPSNEEFRAIFVTFGFELRFDRQRWADRDRHW